jgi:hypothetical protein
MFVGPFVPGKPTRWKTGLLRFDRLNLEPGQVLPVALAHPDAFLGAVAEDENLLAPMLPGNLHRDSRPLHKRLADFHIVAVGDKQNVGQLDYVTNIGIQFFHFKNIAGGYPVLLPTCAYYCVHKKFSPFDRVRVRRFPETLSGGFALARLWALTANGRQNKAMSIRQKTWVAAEKNATHTNSQYSRSVCLRQNRKPAGFQKT